MRTDSLTVFGLGHVSSLGLGIKSLNTELAAGDAIEVDTRYGKKTVYFKAGVEPSLPDVVPPNTLRRMSKISRMALGASFEAVEMAKASGLDLSEPDRIGLIVGTVYGCLEQANRFQKEVLQDGATGSSPTVFSNSIHNSMASQLSLIFQIQGPSFTGSTMSLTTPSAFQMAQDWLDLGHVDHVLIVIGDEVADYHLYAAAHEDSSSTLSEGFVAFLVSRLKHSKLPSVSTRVITDAFQTATSLAVHFS